MTITVLKTWEIEVWPANKSQAPNAVYLQVRHKPFHGAPDLPLGGIRFGLTEAEVHRIAYSLVSASIGERADAVLHDMRAAAEKRGSPVAPTPPTKPRA